MLLFLTGFLGALLSGCAHARLSFPQSPRRRRGLLLPDGAKGDDGAAHCTCLACGKEFTYDWQRMQLAGPREHQQPQQRPRLIRESEAARA